MREVISVNVGQCGVQLSESVWKQYLAEHSIDKDGSIKSEAKESQSSHVFFEETQLNRFVPRNLCVDLESTVIDDLLRSDIGSIFNPSMCIKGIEDAANIFARGHYTIGKEHIKKIMQKLKKLVEACENFQGFIFHHSVGGGTGSGLSSLILEEISQNYRRKPCVNFSLYPSQHLSTSVVEPYNSLLSTQWLLNYSEISVLLDNEAIYEICQRNLNIRHPSYVHLNRLISKVISSITASLRFKGELNVDLIDWQTNLVPFPRLHFLISSMAPILNQVKSQTYQCTTQTITTDCFNHKCGPGGWFTKIDDFDGVNDPFMAISLNYRGDVLSKDATSAIQWLKNNKKVSFVDWSPTGFKIGLNEMPAAIVPDDDIVAVPQNVVMMGNNTAVSRVFSERISYKFDLMYSQRAFVHWYVGEGMEEGEFQEARENLAYLEKDYLDVLSETMSDADDDEHVEESDTEPDVSASASGDGF